MRSWIRRFPERLRARAKSRLALAGEDWRYQKFRLSEWLNDYPSARAEFEKAQGYPLDLRNPRSFNEKLWWRKIHDHNPLFPLIVDKFTARRFAVRTLGKARAAEVLTPLLFHTTDPERIPFDQLPEECVIKASHGWAMNIILRKGHVRTRDDIIDQCRPWMVARHALEFHEWAYSKITPRILVEKLLQGPGGAPPQEYKFHMFGARCELIQVLDSDTWYEGTFDPGVTPALNFYTPEWKKIEMTWFFPAGRMQPPPSNLGEMLELAEQLSRPFDYMRVDLYSVPDGIRLGELTPYHSSGLGPIVPREIDFELGAKWKLKRGWR